MTWCDNTFLFLFTQGSFSIRKYSLSSKTGTLLPDFPNPRLLELPENISLEKVRSYNITTYNEFADTFYPHLIGLHWSRDAIALAHWERQQLLRTDVSFSDRYFMKEARMLVAMTTDDIKYRWHEQRGKR